MELILNDFIENLKFLTEAIFNRIIDVISYPIDPNQRIFVLYLLTSLLIAVYVFLKNLPLNKDKGFISSLIDFLFPKYIWSKSSAWLDIRYFFFHQLFRYSIYGTFIIFISSYIFHFLTNQSLTEMEEAGNQIEQKSLLGEFIYIFVLVLLLDFTAYITHFLQHKIPILWQFHKIHHSPKVLTPFTNYREHPIDNIFYALGVGCVTGLVTSSAFYIFDYVPSIYTILGVGVFSFIFNISGYNLRHSHIWVKWPSILIYILGSPAHHQVHHSYHPKHIDKNFAFLFPVWDLIFGTWEMPEDNRDVKFGINDKDDEYKTCLGLYFLPIKDAYKLIKRKYSKKIKN